MADRPDLPRILPKERPSIFNREAGGWSLFFGFLGSVVAVAAAPAIVGALGITGAAGLGAVAVTEFVGVAAGFVAGFMFGGQRGMLRQQRELEGGRVVKDPTYFNGGVFSGLATVQAIGIVGTSAALLTGTLTATALAAATAPAALTLGALAAPLAVAFGFAALGSIARKHSMQKDLDRSVAIRGQMEGLAMQRGMDESLGQSPAIYKNSVNPLEAALLEAKQSASRGHANNVTAERGTPTEQARS